LTTLEPPPETIAALLDASRGAGASVVLNATPEAIGAGPFLDRVDVLVVNETEAEDLLGYTVEAGNAEAAALALAALGPRTAVITLGAAGATLAHEGRTAAIPAPTVEVVDTTGAGDAFCGAFAAAIARGADPRTAARTGIVAGSLATTVPGAYPSMPWRDAIEHTLAAISRV
jgi:ribokinase